MLILLPFLTEPSWMWVLQRGRLWQELQMFWVGQFQPWVPVVYNDPHVEFKLIRFVSKLIRHLKDDTWRDIALCQNIHQQCWQRKRAELSLWHSLPKHKIDYCPANPRFPDRLIRLQLQYQPTPNTYTRQWPIDSGLKHHFKKEYTSSFKQANMVKYEFLCFCTTWQPTEKVSLQFVPHQQFTNHINPLKHHLSFIAWNIKTRFSDDVVWCALTTYTSLSHKTKQTKY